MFYVICFIVSLVIMLLVLGYGRNFDNNIIFLMIVLAVGNGGYMALELAENLPVAILANKLTYASGAFGPLLVFFTVCNICRVKIPTFLRMALYTIQTAIFMSACTIGRLDIFYKSIELKSGPAGNYLVKTYGPLHSVHLAMLALFTLASMVIAFISIERKSVVSRVNVYLLIFINTLCEGVYIVERVLRLPYEILPMTYIICVLIMLIPLVKIYTYSVSTNENIVNNELSKRAFIVFSRKLRYMSCNKYATELFPELSEWELEKKIPGSGGRFNTFLRKPLNDYAEKNSSVAASGKYSYKGNVFRYEIEPLYIFNKLNEGYVIKITDVTDIVGSNENESEN